MMDGQRKFAVNPFTFRGVASYAHAPLWCLALISLPLALVISSVGLHWVNRAIVPPIRHAIEQLPTRANLKAGILTWPEDATPILSEGPFLSLAVNPSDARPLGQNGDFQLDFRRDRVLLRTILGELNLSYENRWTLGLARAEVEPWWGAWQPLMQGGIFFGMCLFLQLSWFGLATGGTLGVRVLALLLHRNVTVAGSWKLSYAACFCGAMLMGLAILLYTYLQLSLTGLMILMPVHLVVGVVYLIGATIVLPSVSRVGPRAPNPFVAQLETTKVTKAKNENPFGG